MAKDKLTKLELKQLQKAAIVEKKKKAKSDGAGLTFTVSPTGHCAWIIRYRHFNKQREYTISDIGFTPIPRTVS